MGSFSDRNFRKQKAQSGQPSVEPLRSPESAVASPPAIANDPKWSAPSLMTAVVEAQMTQEEFAAMQAPPVAAVAEPLLPEPQAPMSSDARPTRVRVRENGKITLGVAVVRFEQGQILDANHFLPGTFREILSHIHTDPM